MDFWFIVLNILIFVLALGIIIIIHELGHFLVARRAKILCHEFSMGMGPVLVKKKKGETVYSLRAIPIGGFVSMAGEDMNEAMIRKDQVIAVNIDEKGDIKDIIIDNAKEGKISGRVIDYDLYGKDMAGLFIKLEVDGAEMLLNVNRDAMYYYGKGKELQIAPQEKSFESKPLWQRFLVIFAGPLMNFVLAFLLLLIVGFISGKPSEKAIIGELSSNLPASEVFEVGDIILDIDGYEVASWKDIGVALGDVAGKENVIIKIKRGEEELTKTITPLLQITSVGITNFYEYTSDEKPIITSGTKVGYPNGHAKGNLEVDDEILAIWDGVNYVEVNNWQEIASFFATYNSDTVKMKVARNGEELTNPVEYKAWTDSVLESQQVGKIITTMGITAETNFDFFYSFQIAGTRFLDDATKIFRTLGLLFSGTIPVTDLSGPVGIFNMIGQIMQNGALSVIIFIAFLSVNVGILNLLPIPALDGGRLLFLIIEGITRKPLNKKAEAIINNVMFIVLLAFSAFIIFMDIFKLF